MNLLVGSTAFIRTLKLRTPRGESVGFSFRGSRDRGVLSHLVETGYFIDESPDYPVRTILDCGANIGDETLRFLFHHPLAEITAVEADSDNFTFLQRNLANCPRVLAVHGAVWSHDTSLKVSQSPTGNPEATSVGQSGSGEQVRAYSVDTLMRLRSWDSIDILKLDVEGAEHAIFSSSTDWIARVKCLIFEVPDSDHPGTLQLIFEVLRSSRWNGAAVGENLVLIRDGTPWHAQRVSGVKIPQT